MLTFEGSFLTVFSALFLSLTPLFSETDFYQAVLILPFFLFLFTGIMTWALGRFFSRFMLTQLVSVVLLTNAVVALWLGLLTFFFNYTLELSLGTWTKSLAFLEWVLLIDVPASAMLIVVSIVSAVVHVYSTSYMEHDSSLPRFFTYLSLFTFFMLILVSAGNLLLLFLAWEGIGLCSYLLIGFWFTRVQAGKAALKAIFVNRVSDMLLILALVSTFTLAQSFDVSIILGSSVFFWEHHFVIFGVSFHALSFITLFMFFGAMGKSAQFLLHTWLPDAMEGPTPVSALIHAATLVTAGVFLFVRFSLLFEQTPNVLIFVSFVGASTAFFAASSGLAQNDLKKVIAYSTCSQLGYMVFTCGLSHYQLGFFHLVNHAFFKALLFLSAGGIIHANSSIQDIRKYGGLARLLPLSFVMFTIGSLALMGLPFLTGFYSKDIILEVAGGAGSVLGSYLRWIGLITALFTAIYSWRLAYSTFVVPNNSSRIVLNRMHEMSYSMAFALMVLAFGSIFLGYFAKDLFIGWGSPIWNGILIQTPWTTGAQIDGEFMSFLSKIAPFILLCLGLPLVIFFSSSNFMAYWKKHHNTLKVIFYFFSNKWYFDTVYNVFIVRPFLQSFAKNSFRFVDKGYLEMFSLKLLPGLVWESGATVLRLQTGYLPFHVSWLGSTLAGFLIYFC